MRRGPAAPAAARARQERAVALLADGLAGTAGGEPVRAVEALAATVVNRMRAARMRRGPAAWGLDLAGAIAAAGLRPAQGPVCPAFAEACRRIAARAAAGSLPDPTGGAIAWHRTAEAPPEGESFGEAVRIGGLVFLRPPGTPGKGSPPPRA